MNRHTRDRCLTLALVVIALACGGATPPAVEQLGNIRLGPEYSHWLVGPIVRMSTREEVDAYLALGDDAAAAAFIEAFWARRGEIARQAFDDRVEEADRRFSEAGYAGRRTDRGTTFVLHGEPSRIRFENPEFITEPVIEVWEYERAQVGLNGKQPAGVYHFAKDGDLTRFYNKKLRQRRTTAEEIR